MQRDIYDDDHDAFRALARDFVGRYITHESRARWDAEGEIDRATMLAAGELGLIGLSVPEEFGGAGMLQDYRFRAVLTEEVIAAGSGSLAEALSIQDDLAVPYIARMGTPEQKQKWLPGMATGEILGALAMTEPGAGSDLRGIRTTATRVEGGYVVNGSKTFITSGKTADVVVTFVKTGEGTRPDAFSLILIEDGMPGFEHHRKLDKLGFHGHDTAELSFVDVFVPEENLLGAAEGHGFAQLMQNLPLERLSIGVAAAAAAQAGFDWTVSYTREREAFGKRVIDLQNTRFTLAGIAATLDALWAYIDRALLSYSRSLLEPEDAARVKLWATEREWEILDSCLQLFGGYGYMTEYPIARAFVEARVHRIYGGTNEIMKEIIGRKLAG